MSSLIFAFVLDLFIGDPVYDLHPVRVMGRWIRRAEDFFFYISFRAQAGKYGLSPKGAGAILALSLPLFVMILTFTILKGLEFIHPALRWIAGVFGIYTALSIQDLKKEASCIYHHLKASQLDAAKENLSRIVGRDTQVLEEDAVVRATVESVAESTLDGIIAPLFYAALGGAPLALAYKAVNTLDSMIGHKSERYRDFGFTAAKQDELWNWIPARIAYAVTGLASFLVTGKAKEAFRAGWRDALIRPHGNGAIPEAVFAGALGIQLGGPSTYQGEKVEKPFLGLLERNCQREDILKSIQLMFCSSWMMLAGMVLLQFIGREIF